MPSTLTETSTFTATVAVPSDGDAANAASVAGAFQSLANRTKFLHDAQGNGGFTNGAPLAACYNGTVLTVGAFALLVGGAVATYAGGTLTPGGLVAKTWYYLYAASDGAGGVTLSVSTTAPDAAVVWKSDESGVKRFLASFRTDESTANIVWFAREASGRSRYLTALNNGTFFQPQAAGTTALASNQTSNLRAIQDAGTSAKLIPPHARIVEVIMRCTTTNVATPSWSEIGGNAVAQSELRAETPDAKGTGAERGSIDVTSAQTATYRTSDTNTTGVVLVAGYVDR